MRYIIAHGLSSHIHASSLHRLVPLQYQVLYMSACGLVWTSILSAATAGQG